MYKHLLVPIDETPLAADLIGDAIDFAKLLGARVTFFHGTTPDDKSLYGEAALMLAVAPDRYMEKFRWSARTALARAEMAAQIGKVECSSIGRPMKGPVHEEILNAANEAGCDLIVMATHERSSRLSALITSKAVKVVTAASIPVLLAIPGVGYNTPKRRVLARIRDEHRTIAAVLKGMKPLLDQKDADPRILRGAFHFLREFAGRLHHAKEEEYLFALLQKRTSEFDELIAALKHQHEGEAELLASAESAEPPDIEALTQHAWRHMGLEETVLIPATREFLAEEDWVALDEALSGHTDPRFGADDEQHLHSMYAELVNIGEGKCRW